MPAFAEVFRFAPLGALDVLIALAAGAAGVMWFEVFKLRRRRPALV